ncbi:MAG: zf-HC2 domain-containing protein [Deltaproteobacteria bacterium]|nr:zf-HC2 domain-containing protein [Deltaproteobacteria bacterium]
MAEDREVAGIRCMGVLERLSEYIDGEVPPELKAQIEAHLVGCDWCSRFGGHFSDVVDRLRTGLRDAQSLEGSVAERLRRRIDEER